VKRLSPPLSCRVSARWLLGLSLLLSWLLAGSALAHGVASGDAEFVSHGVGARVPAFVYLGAKHMVTGYDHLLFLAGVVFLLRSLRQVVGYVTLFALGHSLTLISFVLLSWRVNATLVDAVIALSVVYKALENLGALVAPYRPDPRAAVFGFGLIHGMGLASKLQTLELSSDGLLANLLAFNVGVELGQLCALSLLVLALAAWRRLPSFGRYAVLTNQWLLMLGFVLVEYQLATYLLRERT
jgi:HupE / UreJ protein